MRAENVFFLAKIARRRREDRLGGDVDLLTFLDSIADIGLAYKIHRRYIRSIFGQYAAEVRELPF